jgi:ATP-dependent Clp protease ATP-binding subunit ClpB
MKTAVMEALRASFKPEFLNRIDETIIFHHLSPDMLGEIVHIQMRDLMKRLADQHINLTLSDNVNAFLAAKGYDEVYGARPLKRAIQKHIENPLSMEILQGNVHAGMTVQAELEGETIRFIRHTG